jgi:hypothetical protein
MHGMMEMRTKVKRVELITILAANKANHRKIFEEALEGYQKEMIKQLLRMLKDVRAGKRIHHIISLPIPRDMTEEYNTALRMLEMSQVELVDLSAQDFTCLVEDKWEWRNDFLASNSTYSQTARTLSAQAMNE